MPTLSNQCSLLDDWRRRRQRLLDDSSLPDPDRQWQLQVLDYLLRRYHDSPIAQRPARFPLRAELSMNERAIVVNHHLWGGRVGSTKNNFDVHNRIAGIVTRMQSAAPPIDEAETALEMRSQELSFWKQLAYGIQSALSRLISLEFRLRSSRISSKKLRRYFGYFTNPACRDRWLLRRLLGLKHPKVNRYAFEAWAERIKSNCHDDVTLQLSSIFRRFTNDEFDWVRNLLADNNPMARLEAIETVGKFGTLDDISLLSDLLALPPQSDDHSQERANLGAAIQQLAAPR